MQHITQKLLKDNYMKTERLKHNQNKSDESKTKLKQFILTMNDENKFKFWIKTLISSYSTIPEIEKTVDKIIEIQASSVSFVSDIYNKNGGTIDQVERVIDLSERKNSLLNIFIMTKKMLQSLPAEHFEFLERKFIYNWSNEELSNYYEISLRTVYRKTDNIISEVYEFCLKNKWTLKFIESQTKQEGWMKERYLKFVSDYLKNTNFKIK